MKEILELIEKLNEDYYERTYDVENSFSVIGNEHFQGVFFSGVCLYNSENDSLSDESGEDISLETYIKGSWDREVDRITSLKPF